MTKFSHSLALNSSPEWRDFYLPYSKLKKICYILERATLGTGEIPSNMKELTGMAEMMSPGDPLEEDVETSALIQKLPIQDANEFFISSLDSEVSKVTDFYQRKFTEISLELENILKSVEEAEIEQHEAYGGSLPIYLPYLLWNTPSLADKKETFKQKMKETFIRMTDLHDFVEINETGVGKVLKKYEKVVGGVVRGEYMEKVRCVLVAAYHTATFVVDV